MKRQILPKRLRTQLMLALLFFTIITDSRAQKNSLRGSSAFCHQTSSRVAASGRPNSNKSVSERITIFNTDFVSAGVGGMRNVGSGQIVLSGISGIVTKAYLYWSGVTNSTTDVGGSIIVNTTAVNGTNIGVSDNNCWGYNNSQAYRAEVTSLIQATGNGVYSLSGFGDLNPNGASLIVFFNDGNTTNNRDVVIFNGNDSNVDFPGIPGNPNAPADPLGWNVTLPGINYSSGTANIQLHVADGQDFVDDELKLNGATLAPTGAIFSGHSVPGANNGPGNNGNLWDIESFNVTSFLSPGTNALNLTTGLYSDCLGLIVALIDLPAGAAPPTVFYSKSAGDLHNLSTWGANPDGSGINPTNFGVNKTFNLANRGASYSLTSDWTVGGAINIPSGAELKLNGFTLTEAELTGAGTLTGSSSSNLVVSGSSGGDAGALKFTGGLGTLNNFTLDRTGPSASATIGSSLNVLGVLTVANGTLNTGNFLTLKSTATNTARVAPIPSTANVIGNVTVERYIPARKAWRLLAAPVGGSQTINAAWQEGVTTASANPNPNPGFGTQITGGTTANGFDQPLATSSIKRYNSATDTWVPVPNTNATAVNDSAYMLFVAGNRTINPSNTTTPATSTTLRVRGPLKIGDQTFFVPATGFVAIRNPYASPIDFATVTRNNVQNSFYLWDPKMGGANGVGAYVNVSWNGSSYDVTPASVSPESQYIQSGQGFMVHSTGVAGSLVIKETDKSATPAMNVFRTAQSPDPALRINLHAADNSNNTTVLDEVFASFNRKYSNKIDEFDVVKMPNIQENLSILRDNQNLMVERRDMINESLILNLDLGNTTEKEYFFEFNPTNLENPALLATLEDKYLHTSTPISLSNVSQNYFKITSDAASKAADRFRVVFVSDKLIPITDGKPEIKATPNPITTGGTFNLQLINQPKGIYNIEIVNGLGSRMMKSVFNHEGGTVSKPIRIGNTLAKGIYQIMVTNGDTKKVIKVLVN